MSHGTFAFTVHPTDISLVHKRWPITRAVPTALNELLISFKPPFEVSRVTGVRSGLAEAEGSLIAIPLTTAQWHRLPEEFLIRRVVEAAKIAERRGARILGLGAHSAIPGDCGKEVARRVSIPITTGNSYTVAAAVEGLQVGARLMGSDLGTGNVVILGATGSIGACCARILARECSRITLAGRDVKRLKALADRILGECGLICQITTDVPTALQKADAVLAVSSSVDALINPADLKPGAVVCDVALPRDVDARVARARNDVLVIDGALVSVPGDLTIGYDVGLPPGVSWACLAETMLLALEKRYEHFTLGRDLTINQVDDIVRIARKHGFKLAGLRSFHRPVTAAMIDSVRQNAAQQRREEVRSFR